MVKFSDLKAPRERLVRNIVQTPTGTIRVFEPSIEDFDNILEIQREKGIREGDTVNFDGVVVIREIFPVLTDLEFADITDEEVEAILEEPSIHLLAVQNYVSQIVTEINTLFMQRVRTELMQANAVVDQAQIVSSIPEIMSKEALRTGDGDMARKLQVIAGVLPKEEEEESEEQEEPKG